MKRKKAEALFLEHMAHCRLVESPRYVALKKATDSLIIVRTTEHSTEARHEDHYWHPLTQTEKCFIYESIATTNLISKSRRIAQISEL